MQNGCSGPASLLKTVAIERKLGPEVIIHLPTPLEYLPIYPVAALDPKSLVTVWYLSVRIMGECWDNDAYEIVCRVGGHHRKG